MIHRLIFLIFLFVFSPPVFAQSDQIEQKPFTIESVTLAGAPIATKHFQTGNENFRERHGLVIAKAHTKNYGNWAAYFLNPNSVDRTSVGAGYVTDPYIIPAGRTQFEFSVGLGLVTGYEDYPLPLLAGEVNWIFYDQEGWHAGLGMAALPYITDDDVTGGTDWGIVATSPYLVLRYQFNPK